MKKLISAFATDDGFTFINRHFGDANFYDIYEISEKEVNFLIRIENRTEDDLDEMEHGNIVKAQSISSMLKEEGVMMVISQVFGPNLKRIKKQFLCVINKEGNIKESIIKLKSNIPLLIEEWSKNEERSFIKL